MTCLAAEQVPRAPANLQENWETVGPMASEAKDPASVRFRLVRSASASTSMNHRQKHMTLGAGAMIFF